MTGPARPRLPGPRKRFGQNFLHDTRVLTVIADALGDIQGQTVIEIGPGRGALTDLLVARRASLTAVELDRDLAGYLEERYSALPNVRVISGDILGIPLGDITTGPYKLVGNVPYYITTPIIFHALRNPRPELAVYLVQKEVAERLAAAPGAKAYGALTVNVTALAEVELLAHVPPGAFNPRPTVDSAVVRLTPLANPVINEELEDSYRRFVMQAFGLRRKQLVRALRTITSLSADACLEIIGACGLDPVTRPETLSPADFGKLVRLLDQRNGS